VKAAVPLFVALALGLTWPLAAHLDTHIPGPTADDNVAFLWNFWWMRRALAGPDSFWHTGMLFHPVGVDLILHTHTALNAFAGATLLRGLSLPAALNVTTIAMGALNGLAAWLLAYRITRHQMAALAGGIYFALCPSLMSHVQGHFNLFSAWGLPLYAVLLFESLQRASWRLAALAGAVFAAIAYSDYYYVVYAGAFTGCVFAWRWWSADVQTAPVRRPQTALDIVLLLAIAGALLINIVVAVTGGGVFTIGSQRVSLTTGLNVRTVAWAALAWWLWRRYRPAIRIHSRPGATPGRDARLLSVAGGTGAAAMWPLIAGALRVWQSGEYASQAYHWRSAPAGVDLAGLVAGNPFSLIMGEPARLIYEAAGLDRYAEIAWLGLTPLVLLIATRRQWWASAHARFWAFVLIVFFVWAMGPYVSVLGIHTGLHSPQLLLRYVPIVANARLPGHAIVMVALAIAMLLALAIAGTRLGRSRAWGGALLALILIELWPRPLPLLTLDRLPVYEILAAAPPGAVLEVPVGIRDGFGAEGRLDSSVLYFQTIHGRPIVGGYVSRLSPSIARKFHESLVLSTLLRLSAGESLRLPPESGVAAADALAQLGVRYVVVNTDMASQPVREYVATMPLTRIAAGGVHEVYQLGALPNRAP
jgi:hypothetical protein